MPHLVQTPCEKQESENKVRVVEQTPESFKLDWFEGHTPAELSVRQLDDPGLAIIYQSLLNAQRPTAGEMSSCCPD